MDQAYRAVEQVHSQGISSVLVYNFHGIGIVLQALAHFLAISSQNQSVNDQVLERRFVEQSGGQNLCTCQPYLSNCSQRGKQTVPYHKGVEPTAGLVKTFSNEISGETFLESFLVLKRVVNLQ